MQFGVLLTLLFHPYALTGLSHTFIFYSLPEKKSVMAFVCVHFEKHNVDLRCPIVGVSTMASHLVDCSRALHLLLQTDSAEDASTIWVTSSGIGEWRIYPSVRLMNSLLLFCRRLALIC